MSENITLRINDNLNSIFNIENDDIFKSVICDDTGTIPATITVPTDIDIGAIASQIEYLRLLSLSLAKQVYIDQATGLFLKYELEEFFNCVQLEGETEAQWIARVIYLIFQPRVSTAAIISALRLYSDPDALVTLSGSVACQIDITVYNVLVDSQIIINLIDAYIAAGITYTLTLISAYPVPGNSGILHAAVITNTAMILTWTAGTDNRDIPSVLSYAVYRSYSNNISTITDCETNGTLVQDYTANITSCNINNLDFAGVYYFNVIIKDVEGNKAIYTAKRTQLIFGLVLDLIMDDGMDDGTE